MIKRLPGLAVKSYRELASGMFAHKSNLQLQGKIRSSQNILANIIKIFMKHDLELSFKMMKVIVRIGEEWFYFYL